MGAGRASTRSAGFGYGSLDQLAALVLLVALLILRTNASRSSGSSAALRGSIPAPFDDAMCRPPLLPAGPLPAFNTSERPDTVKTY